MTKVKYDGFKPPADWLKFSASPFLQYIALLPSPRFSNGPPEARDWSWGKKARVTAEWLNSNIGHLVHFSVL